MDTAPTAGTIDSVMEEPLRYDIDRMATPWFEGPFLEPLLAKANLPTDQAQLVRDFARDGYLIVDDLGLDDFDAIADSIVRDLAPRYTGPIRRVTDAWRFHDGVRRLATAPKIAELLRLLYRRDPIPFQTLNFDVGTEQKLHSDLIHFDSIPRRYMAGVWVALEDIDESNGALMYVPGSHRFPEYHYTDIGLPPEESAYPHYARFVELLCEHQGHEPVVQPMRRGQALIWSANLLHGGSPIGRPGSTRHSQVTHFYFDDCTWYIPRLSQFPGRLCFREVCDIRTGQLATPMAGGGPVDLDLQEWVWRVTRPDDEP